MTPVPINDPRPDELGNALSAEATMGAASRIETSFDRRVHGPVLVVVRSSITSRIVRRVRRLMLGGGKFGIRATVSRAGAASTLAGLWASPQPFRITSLMEPADTRRLIEHDFGEEADPLMDRRAQIERGEKVLLVQSWSCRPHGWHPDPSGESA